MRFGVLGPIAAWTDGGDTIPIQGAKVRALLADLIVHLGTPVAADRLIDDLWGESPGSANPAGLLSSKVSQLRRALDAAEPGARAVVVSPPPGYTLAVAPAAVDAHEFSSLVDDAETAEARDPARTVEVLERALAMWRGPAYGEVADLDFVRGAVAHLDERRLTAHETLARARLALGDHARVADELTALVEAHPWREELRLTHVLALYRAGRQPDALASYERYRRHLVEELGIDPSRAAVALHHSVLVQDPDLAGPASRPGVLSGAAGSGSGSAASAGTGSADLPALRRPPANLPPLRSELIGRDTDLADLSAMLRAGNLVTLTGPGGVGKTTLALAAAHDLSAGRRDAAWFVDLAAVERTGALVTADVVADAVSAVLAIRQGSDAADSATSVDRLADALHGQEAVLVLDNCEHVIDAAASVADRLLRDAPGVTVLATSREPLGVPGEAVRPVAPLQVPDPRDQRDPDRVAQADAVRLFVARARAAGATLDVDGRTAPLVGTLCRRLDGLPLALELAATRVPALGLAEVVAHLGDRFRLLGSGRRGGPERHRTLEAMLDWSWDLLEQDERRALRRMAVHADGCTLAATTVIGAGAAAHLPGPAGIGEHAPGADRGVLLGPDPSGTADVLGRLVDRSLVVAEHRLGDTRYRLLESVRAYATERLAEAGELDAVRGRHLDWYLAIAEEADEGLRGHDHEAWLRTLDAESANMLAALDAAVDLGRAAEAHRLVAALGWYWSLRGRTAVAARAFEQALGLPADVPTEAHARAGCLWHAARITLGDLDDPVGLAAAALARFDARDAPVMRARCAAALGAAMTDAGAVREGEALMQEAVEVAVAHGDTWGEAAALLGLATHAHMHGEIERLSEVATRSGVLFAELGDAWGRLAADEWLGALAELEADLDTAEKLLTAGLDEAERLGLWRHVASRLGLLGWIAHQRGDWPTARRFGAQAGRLAVEQADRSLEVLAEMVQGFAARQQGDLAVATGHLQVLLAGSGVDPDDVASGAVDGADLPIHAVTALGELAHVAELAGEPARALALHRAVADAAVASGFPRDLAGALEGGAVALAALGDPASAARALGAAADVRAWRQMPAAPAERRNVERALDAVLAAIGGDAVDRLMEEGRTIDPRVALAAEPVA